MVPKGNMFIIENGGKFDREVEDKCEFMNPCLDQVAYRIDTREFIVKIDKATAILKDNVSVGAEGVAQIDVLKQQACVQEISDFLNNIRQRTQSSLRTTLGRLTLQELFQNRTTVTSNVETALNSFFEENDNCAKLCRFEITEISPQGIDLTKESIAEREKIAQIIESEADKYKEQKISEAN